MPAIVGSLLRKRRRTRRRECQDESPNLENREGNRLHEGPEQFDRSSKHQNQGITESCSKAKLGQRQFRAASLRDQESPRLESPLGCYHQLARIHGAEKSAALSSELPRDVEENDNLATSERQLPTSGEAAVDVPSAAPGRSQLSETTKGSLHTRPSLPVVISQPVDGPLENETASLVRSALSQRTCDLLSAQPLRGPDRSRSASGVHRVFYRLFYEAKRIWALLVLKIWAIPRRSPTEVATRYYKGTIWTFNGIGIGVLFILCGFCALLLRKFNPLTTRDAEAIALATATQPLSLLRKMLPGELSQTLPVDMRRDGWKFVNRMSLLLLLAHQRNRMLVLSKPQPLNPPEHRRGLQDSGPPGVALLFLTHAGVELPRLWDLWLRDAYQWIHDEGLEPDSVLPSNSGVLRVFVEHHFAFHPNYVHACLPPSLRETVLPQKDSPTSHCSLVDHPRGPDHGWWQGHYRPARVTITEGITPWWAQPSGNSSRNGNGSNANLTPTARYLPHWGNTLGSLKRLYEAGTQTCPQCGFFITISAESAPLKRFEDIYLDLLEDSRSRVSLFSTAWSAAIPVPSATIWSTLRRPHAEILAEKLDPSFFHESASTTFHGGWNSIDVFENPSREQLLRGREMVEAAKRKLHAGKKKTRQEAANFSSSMAELLVNRVVPNELGVMHSLLENLGESIFVDEVKCSAAWDPMDRRILGFPLTSIRVCRNPIEHLECFNMRCPGGSRRFDQPLFPASFETLDDSQIKRWILQRGVFFARKFSDSTQIISCRNRSSRGCSKNMQIRTPVEAYLIKALGLKEDSRQNEEIIDNRCDRPPLLPHHELRAAFDSQSDTQRAFRHSCISGTILGTYWDCNICNEEVANEKAQERASGKPWVPLFMRDAKDQGKS